MQHSSIACTGLERREKEYSGGDVPRTLEELLRCILPRDHDDEDAVEGDGCVNETDERDGKQRHTSAGGSAWASSSSTAGGAQNKDQAAICETGERSHGRCRGHTSTIQRHLVVGSRVKIRDALTRPRFGWGCVTTRSLGMVVEVMQPEGVLVKFPESECNWHGLQREIEIVTDASSAKSTTLSSWCSRGMTSFLHEAALALKKPEHFFSRKPTGRLHHRLSFDVNARM